MNSCNSKSSIITTENVFPKRANDFTRCSWNHVVHGLRVEWFLLRSYACSKIAYLHTVQHLEIALSSRKVKHHETAAISGAVFTHYRSSINWDDAPDLSKTEEQRLLRASQQVQDVFADRLHQRPLAHAHHAPVPPWQEDELDDSCYYGVTILDVHEYAVLPKLKKTCDLTKSRPLKTGHSKSLFRSKAGIGGPRLLHRWSYATWCHTVKFRKIQIGIHFDFFFLCHFCDN